MSSARTPWIPCLALLLAAAVLAPPVAAQRPYKDEKYGYGLMTFSDWEAMPPQPRERYLVSKWVSERRIRDLPAEIHVYVFDRDAEAKKPEGLPEGAEIPAGAAEIFARMAPKQSYKEWAKDDRERGKMALERGRRLRVKAPEGRKVLSSKVFITKRPSLYRRGTEVMPDFFVMVGVITTEELEYAVECFCSEDTARTLRGKFMSVIRSFHLLEDAEVLAKEAEAAAEGSGDTANDEGYERTDMTPKERALERAMENAKRAPGWWHYETPRYVIVTNVEKRRKPFIADIGRRLEAMRDQYERDFPPKDPITAVSICRVCKDKDSYSAYGGPGGSAGYWNSAAEELVFYRENSTDTPFKVLNHEAFHQYIHYACGEINPHIWYNEGFGDYYSGAVIRGRRVVEIEPFDWRRDTIRQACRDGSYVPIREIIHYTKAQYYSDSQLCYAQGWSMVYFLKQGVADRHPWKKILPTYLEVLQETGDRDKATEAAFEGVDLDEFEKAWKAFTVKGRKLYR